MLRFPAVFTVAVVIGMTASLSTLSVQAGATRHVGAGPGVTNIATGAMLQRDVPAHFTVMPPIIARTFAAFLTPHPAQTGQLGYCASGATASEKRNFVLGLTQAALDSAKNGILECVESFNSSTFAHQMYLSALQQTRAGHWKPFGAARLGAESFSASFHQGTGEYLHGTEFRRGSTTVTIISGTTKNTITDAQLYAVAVAIAKRLK